MAMLRGAVVNEQASMQLREFIQARLLNAVGQRGVGDDAVLRAGLASSMLVGLVLGRRIVGVPALVDADGEKLVTLVAPTIQNILAPESSRPPEVSP
ncbi:hypothetical protein NLX62_08125, partial [Mycobacteriaceae bacterium Msp059]|nr:hypothetical protein [Mycobacteriaceae bacterium Msp059]